MLVEGLQTYLAADSGLQGLLGTPSTRKDKSTGIFPVVAPSAVPMPYMVISQVTGESLQESFQGTGALQTQRWRFSCYGTSYRQAKILARALKRAMVSCDGTLAAGQAEVHGAWLRLEADDAEPIPHGTVFATHVDFEINYLDNDTATN